MAKVSYVCETAPGLKIRIQDGPEIEVKFENKMLRFDDEIEADREKIALLDGLIANRPNISILIRKVEYNTALAAAARHKAEMGVQNAAAKGGTHTGHFNQANRNVMARGDAKARLLADGIEEEKIDQILDELEKDSNILVARKVELPQDTGPLPPAQPKDGFVADSAVRSGVSEAQDTQTLQQLPPIPTDEDNPEGKTGDNPTGLSIFKQPVKTGKLNFSVPVK